MARPRRDPFTKLRLLPPGEGAPGWVYVTPEGYGEGCQRTQRGMIWVCPHCGTFYWAPQPCTRLDCAECAGKVKARRGNRHFKSLGGQPVLHWVLTFPMEWREELSPARSLEIRKLGQAVVRGWFLEHYEIEIGLLASFHPTGSTCRKCRRKVEEDRLAIHGVCPHCGAPAPWIPHLDLVIPCAGLRRGIPITFPAFMPAEHLESFKATWHNFMGEVAEHLGLELPERLNSFMKYQTTPARVHHCLAYSGRPFPAFYTAMPSALRTPQRYGLLSPGVMHTRDKVRLDALEKYRALVAGELEDPAGQTCPCCEQAELDLFGTMKTNTLAWLRFKEDLGKLGTPLILLPDVRGPPPDPHASTASSGAFEPW